MNKNHNDGIPHLRKKGTATRLIVAGAGFTLSFAPKLGEDFNVEILTLDEGRFENSKWIPSRCLNGDEPQAGRLVYMGDELGVCKVKVYSYP